MFQERKLRKSPFSLNGDEALGPDGYNALFFKKAWPVTGCDVLDAIKDFFDNGRLL